jgi:hypothetical protein
MCVYASSGFGATLQSNREPESGENEAGAGRTGVVLYFAELKDFGFMSGTWAVTARE